MIDLSRKSISPSGSASGFALVGVIMFVLVLTILGLSLFSLASFESQFVSISDSRAESFYAASDGLDRARFVLESTNSLTSVGTNLPDGTIVYAKAKQGSAANFNLLDSLTNDQVQWNGADIWIRALAIRRGQRTLLEARYRPFKPENYYRRLMTLSGGLTVIPIYPVGGVPTARQLLLTGEVWRNIQSGPLPLAASEHNPVGGVLAPQVNSYITSHSSAAVTVVESHPSAQHDVWVLNVTGGLGYKFFKTPAGGAQYSVLQNPAANDVNINVTGNGTAIWLLNRGMRSDILVNVTGNPATSSLVIVAGQTTQPGPENVGRGFNLLGSITSTIPIVFVTDGVVDIEHKSNTSLQAALLPFMSIYARDVQLMGPGLPGLLTMIYPPAVLNPILDPLYNLGILPNSSAGVANQMNPVTGTWRDLTASNPS